jgi:hypothetical protein
MAEWLKAAVLKTVVPSGTVGSNPTPSAIRQDQHGEMAESAEGARLLSECRVKSSTEGSNPSLSATRANPTPSSHTWDDGVFFLLGHKQSHNFL